jgi:hypothetical protein
MTNIATPDRRELRNFGLTMAAIVAVLFGLLLPWIFSGVYRPWPWIVAGGLAGTGLLAPLALGLVYRLWMRFGHVMGAINTRLILGLFFYLIVTPIGSVMRLFRWDPMRRRRMQGVSSYRVNCTSKSSQHMEKPF